MKKSIKFLIIGISSLVVIVGAVLGIVLLRHNTHTWDQGTITTNATCMSEGVITYHCTGCDEVRKETIPMLEEHNWNEGVVISNPTCVEDGRTLYTCTVCEYTEEKVVLAKGHVEGTPATCSSKAICSVCKKQFGERLSHNYTYVNVDNNWHRGICECGQETNMRHDHKEEVVKEAGCLTAGITNVTCSLCDYNEVIEVEPLGHSWDSPKATCENGQTCLICSVKNEKLEHNYILVNTSLVTCSEDGFEVYECSECGDQYRNITVTSTGHNVSKWTFVSTQPLANKTCQAEEIYKGFCKLCNQMVEKKEIVEKHNYVTSIGVLATCSHEGTYHFECQDCNNEYDKPYSNANAHNFVEINSSSSGNVKEYECEHCHETKTIVLAKTEVSTELSKDILASNEVALKNATIKLDNDTINNLGSSDITLTADTVEDEYRDEIVNSLPEDKKEALGDNKIYNFLMEQDGSNVTEFNGVVTVTVPYELAPGEDPESIAIWYINDLGEVESIPASYSNGTATFETSHFSYYSVIRLSAADRCKLYGHWFTEKVYEKTCTADGYKLSICSRCGESQISDIEKATGHSFISTRVEPTCEARGYVEKECAKCEYKDIEYIKPLGHNYELKEQKDATCKESGYTIHECTNENCDKEITKYEKQKPHTFEITIVKVTCTTDGYRTSKCTICEYEKTDNHAKATGHKYQEILVEPTCTEKGYTLHQCSNCDDNYIDTYVDEAHTWNIEAATCAEAKYCVICDVVGEEKTTNHTIVNGVCSVCGTGCDHNFNTSTVEPTCTEKGYTKDVCSICQFEKKSNFVDALGHQFDEFACTICGVETLGKEFFSDFATNLVDTDITIHMENVTVPESWKYLIAEEMGEMELFYLFNRIGKLEVHVNLDSEDVVEGYAYASVIFNTGANQEVEVEAYALIEDNNLYVLFNNIEKLINDNYPEVIYIPLNLLFNSNAEEHRYDNEIFYAAQAIKELKKFGPTIKKIAENLLSQDFVAELVQKIFASYFELEETDKEYIFSSKENAFELILTDVLYTPVDELLGEDIMKFIEDLKTMTLGDLLDKFETFGTKFSEIEDKVNELVELVSEGEYKSLYEFIKDVYGLSAVINREKLKEYTFVSFVSKLSGDSEDEIKDDIDSFIEEITGVSIAEGCDIEEDEFDAIVHILDKYFGVNISISKSSYLNNIEIVVKNVDNCNLKVNLTNDYNSYIDYTTAKKNVMKKVEEYDLNSIVDNEKYYYDELDGKSVLVEDNSHGNVYTNVEGEYDPETGKYYLYSVEFNRTYSSKYYNFLENYGILIANEDGNEYVSYIFESKYISEEKIEKTYYDYYTGDLVKTEEVDKDYDYHGEYDSEYYTFNTIYVDDFYNCDHKYVLDETRSITPEKCGSVAKQYYICDRCGFEYITYAVKEHTYVPTHEFLSETKDCYSGVDTTLTCSDCNHSFEMPTNYSHMKYMEIIDVSEFDGECEHTVEMRNCACSYNGIDFVVDGGWHYEGENETYKCSKCNLTIVTDRNYMSANPYNNCNSITTVSFLVSFGDVIVKEVKVVEEQENHNIIYFGELIEGASTCEEGVKVTKMCRNCHEILGEEVLYDCPHKEYGYYSYYSVIHDLKEYGSDYKVYRQGCCIHQEETHNTYEPEMVYIFGEKLISLDYHMQPQGNPNDSYAATVDGVTVGLMDHSTTEGCLEKNEYILYINFDSYSYSGEYEYKIHTSEYARHKYEYEYEFLTEEENCEEGVKVTYTCKFCDYSYTSEYDWHYELSKQVRTFEEYGCTHAYYYTYECPCGERKYNNDYYYEANMSYYSGYINDEYVSGYKCNDCDFIIGEASSEYITVDECHRKRITTQKYYFNGAVVDVEVTEEIIESHSWEKYVGLIEGSTSCDEGCFSIRKCSDCGAINEEFAEHSFYHVYGCIAVIDAGKISKMSNSTGIIYVYGCACGYDLSVHYSEEFSHEYSYDEEKDEYIDYYRSTIDGLCFSYAVFDEYDECNKKSTLIIEFGYYDKNESKYVVDKNLSFEQTFITCEHSFGDIIGYQFINGKNHSNGMYVSRQCEECDYILKTKEYDCISIELDAIRFEQYGSEAYIQKYGCPCGNSYFEYSEVGFELQNNSREYYDNSIDAAVAFEAYKNFVNEYNYWDYSFDLTTFELSVETATDETGNISIVCTRGYATCADCLVVEFRIVKYYNGEVELGTLDEYCSIYSNHYTRRFVELMPESNDCYDGVRVIEICQNCNKIESEYDTYYHYQGYVSYLDLSKYGVNGQIYQYGCPCGYYSDGLRYNFGYEERWDDEGNLLIYEYSTGLCIKYVEREEYKNCHVYQYVDLFINYDVETQEYEELVSLKGRSYESHNYEIKYELVNPYGNCEDGVREVQVCSECGDRYSYTTHYYHYEYEQYIDLDEEFAICGEQIVVSGCACGEVVSFAGLNEGYGDIDCTLLQGDGIYYLYKCAVTEPQCFVKIIAHYYRIYDGCEYVEYCDLYVNCETREEIEGREPDYEFVQFTGTNHSYEYELVEYNTNIPCYKYYEEIGTCSICGKTYVSKYYHDWKHELVSETSDDGLEKVSNCENCDYYSKTIYDEEGQVIEFEEKGNDIIRNISKNEVIFKTVHSHQKYIYQKGYQYTTYDKEVHSYTNDVKEEYGYEDYFYEISRVYTFNPTCHVVETQNYNGKISTDEHSCCRLERYYGTTVYPTCTQSGTGLFALSCCVCENTKYSHEYEVVPYEHNFYWNGDYYYCNRCGIENSNGANGNVTLEDCSDMDSDSDSIIVGYYNPYGYKEYQIVVSIVVKDEYLVENVEGSTIDNQLPLDEVKVSMLTTGRYIKFSLADVKSALAKAVSTNEQDILNRINVSELTDEMYDIRLTFVPTIYGDALEYAITIPLEDLE